MKNPFATAPPGAAIEQEHQKSITLSNRLAREAGERNLPREGEPIAPYLKQLTAAYNSMISRYVIPHLSLASESAAQSQQSFLQGKKASLIDQRDSLLSRLHTARLTKNSLDKTGDNGKYIGSHLLIAGVALFEAWYTAPAFRLFSHNSNIAQIGVFAGLVIVFFLLPIAISGIIRKTEEVSPTLKWIIRGGVGAITIGAFIVFGIFRATFLQHLDTDSLTSIKAGSVLPLRPWYFALISSFLLMLTVYLCLRFPSKVQRDAARELDEASSDVNGMEAELHRIEDQIYRLPDTEATNQQRILQNKALAQENAQLITSLYHQCIGEYINTNQRWRPDGKSVSSSDIPDLDIPIF